MEAQKALNELASYLLGKDWYSEYICVDAINDDIVGTIERRYHGADETPVSKWRRQHKRCYFCEHCRMVRDVPYASDIFMCDAKGKIVNISRPRPFCTLFELTKDEKEKNHD